MDPYFRFQCPNPVCNKRLKATLEHVGRRARCTCGQSVIVPHPEPLSLDDDPPAPPPAPLVRTIPPPAIILPLERSARRLVGSPRRVGPARTERSRFAAVWPMAGAVAVLAAIAGGVWLLVQAGPTAHATPTQGYASASATRAAVPMTAEAPWDIATEESIPVEATSVPTPRGVEETIIPEPKPVPAPGGGKLSEQVLGDWKSTGGWEVSFTKSGSIVVTTPSYWHATFYNFVSADTIKYPAPPSPGAFPGSGPTDEVVKLKLAGDELTMSFDRGPTVKLVRAQKPRK
ncbi:MAG TPA: hypothetical protein VMZ71_12420 [Gemmataceae bacterium]|nr:hypothetical protein [Gemmataceae bacterium]